MDIHFFAAGSQAPAARYRVEQFLPHFRARGVRAEYSVAYGTLYNQLASTRLGMPYKFACRFKRGLAQLASAAHDDIAFLQRKAFRELSIFEEVMVRQGARIVFDFDDAVFLGNDHGHHAMRQRSFERVCAISAHIIAGNGWLAERAGYPDKTTVIPTVIDADLYTPALRSASGGGGPVIGWMGTSSSYGVAEPVMPHVMAALERHPQATLRLVSNARVAALEGHPQVEQIPWSAEREIELLRSFDVGIMPLIDAPVTRGKCGFKMILYMAVGCPVVASPVGANVEILEGSGAGFLAEGAEGWAEAFDALLGDAAARARTRMGEAARARCVERYSVRGVLDTYMEIFERVARAPR